MMERSAVTVVRPTGGDFGAYASTTKSSASSAAPTKRKYRTRGISRSLHPRDRADQWLNREWRDLFLTWRGQATKLPPRCDLYENCPDLDVAGREQRALRLAGIDVDEADMDTGEGLSALHTDGVAKQTGAVGQVAAVRSGEGTGNLDIL